MNPSRVLAYVRVSGQEQGRHGTSLDGQQSLVRSFCAMREWPEPAIYIEIESAGAEKIERRSELRRLLKDAKAGDMVLVCAVDRWSRDLVFAVQSVRELVARKVRFVSINDNLDTSTPQSDSMLGIMAWVADGERQRIKARTVGRRSELRAEGKHVEGRVAFGYRRENRTLVIVESEAAVVREAFRMCCAGWSLREIADELSSTTDHAWGLWRVHWMLRNRTYLGEVATADGQAVRQRAHPAIVDAATFDHAQSAMSRRRQGNRKQGDSNARTRNWLMAGIAICAACGCAMGAAYGNNNLDYYACATRRRGRICEAKYVRVDEADRRASELVDAHLAELRHALARSGGAAKARDITRTQVAAKRKRLEDQLQRATRLAVEGLMTPAELRTQRERIERDLSALAADEAEIERAVRGAAPEARRALLKRVDVLRDAWARLPVADKRRVLCLLAHEIRLSFGTDPSIVWRTTEELAEEAGGRNESSV